MAQRYYGLDKGETQKDVTEGNATTATTDVEIRIDLAQTMEQSEVYRLITEITNAILQDIYPPA